MPPSAPAADCERGPGARAFERGHDQAAQRVARRWDQHGGGCDGVESFADHVVEVMEDFEDKAGRGSSKSQRVCRWLGRLDGAFYALDVVQNQCIEQCFLRGEVVGALAATTFCELALTGAVLDAQRYFRAPVNVCGLGYEVACDATFLGDTLGYADDAGACEPFTTGDSFPAWDATRSRACAYEQREVPESPGTDWFPPPDGPPRRGPPPRGHKRGRGP